MKRLNEVQEKVTSLLDDFNFQGVLVFKRINNYLDSPSILKFYDERYIKLHPLNCSNFDETEITGDMNERKFKVWLHSQLKEFHTLIKKIRKFEDYLTFINSEYEYNKLSSEYFIEILYDLYFKMSEILEKIQNHKIQKIDTKLSEISVELISEEIQCEQLKIFEIIDYLKLRAKKENEDFVNSVIKEYPEILETNIADVENNLNFDFYFTNLNCNFQGG